jgi:zinc protease
MFFASAIFPDTVFLKARKALKEECERWATDGVSAKEVSSRKEEVLGKRVVMLAPLTVRAHVLADALRAGKSLASLDEYPEKIEALSRAEVNHAIHIHLDPTHFRTASAGSVPKG